MSTRTALRPEVVLNAASMATNQTSAVTILQSLSRISYSVSWTGSTPVGTVTVQGSNDYAVSPDGRTVINAGTWSPLTVTYSGTNLTDIPVSGNSGNGIIDITTSIYALRLVYTAGSGTGNITVVVTGKVS